MIRVLQIPGDHPYVEHCTTGIAGVQSVSIAGTPSPALDPQWLESHHHEFDAAHLHFGFEHLGPTQMRHWVETLIRLDLPLFYTVHDLRNPHQLSPAPHDHHLDILIPSATAVFTLTSAAAREIAHRWGRQATVVPHPYVVDPGDRPSRPASTRTVGIQLKDLRRNIVEPDRLISAAARGAADGDGRLQVDLHPGVRDHPELSLTRALSRAGKLKLSVHQRFSDRELADYLAALDVLVLPYRFGTHSGWLEACRDVGTRVVVPSCGYYADQWDESIVYHSDESTGLDETSLSEAVREALLSPPLRPAEPEWRRRQRALVRTEHAHVYLDAVRSHRAAS